MNAVVLVETGGIEQFQLQRVSKPEPKNGEVRIRVKAAGFNPVDYKMRRGDYGRVTSVILGADCSGFVDATGPGVAGFSIGDEVYALAFGQGSNGSYAQYLCLPHQFVEKKPKNLSFQEAASIPLSCMTAYRAISALRFSTPHQSIFIAGASGGVGSYAIQLIQHYQWADIFVIAGGGGSVELLTQKLGLRQENIVLYDHLSIEEIKEKLIHLNSGNLFSATFDFVGGDITNLCLQLTKHSGYIVSLVPSD